MRVVLGLSLYPKYNFLNTIDALYKFSKVPKAVQNDIDVVNNKTLFGPQ